METGQSLNSISAVNPSSLVAPELFLALALLTIGIPRNPVANGGDVVEFVEEIAGKKQRRFVFVFDPAGTEGVDTATWIARWQDAKWLAANPAHPLASFKQLSATYAQFAGWMQEHVPVFVFRGCSQATAEGQTQRVAYVPENLFGTPRGEEILRKSGIQL